MKLNHYGIRGTVSNCFSSYLEKGTQFVSINGYSSDLHFIGCGVPQCSILGPLFINRLPYPVKHLKIHHFADDTNLLNFNHSIKKMNKQVNCDLKNLNNWLNANKISLNLSKTDVVLFKWPKKQTDCNLHLKLNGKRLYLTDSVKYFGIKIDENFKCHYGINNIAAKLNKANYMLSKVRHRGF